MDYRGHAVRRLGRLTPWCQIDSINIFGNHSVDKTGDGGLCLTLLVTSPKDSLYQGHTFSVNIDLGTGHPFKAPNITIANFYHPNVCDESSAALWKTEVGDFDLSQDWYAGITIEGVVMIVYSLFINIYFEDICIKNIEAYSWYIEDPDTFSAIASIKATQL